MDDLDRMQMEESDGTYNPITHLRRFGIAINCHNVSADEAGVIVDTVNDAEAGVHLCRRAEIAIRRLREMLAMCCDHIDRRNGADSMRMGRELIAATADVEKELRQHG